MSKRIRRVEKQQNPGKPITCVSCGKGGGTLENVGMGKYRHKECPRRK